MKESGKFNKLKKKAKDLKTLNEQIKYIQDNQDKSSFHGSIGHSVSRFLPNSPQKIPHAFL